MTCLFVCFLFLFLLQFDLKGKKVVYLLTDYIVVFFKLVITWVFLHGFSTCYSCRYLRILPCFQHACNLPLLKDSSAISTHLNSVTNLASPHISACEKVVSTVTFPTISQIHCLFVFLIVIIWAFHHYFNMSKFSLLECFSTASSHGEGVNTWTWTSIFCVSTSKSFHY